MLLRSIVVTLIAGGCWWLSFDLGLHWWWPIWLAPLPVLWMAPGLSGWGTVSVAFLAFLIGRCAWLGYLLSVLPVVPALLFTILPALCFALCVLPARVFLRRGQPVLAALSFAVLWTTVEFLLASYGRDGTIVSIAYTQSSFLPVVQVAALTGVAGITFVLCLVPALVAGRKWVWAAAVAVVVLGYGCVRMLPLNFLSASTSVGMVVLPESVYGGQDYEPDAAKEMNILGQYCGEIEKLAAAKVGVVVIPEKALPVTNTTSNLVDDSLARMAARLKVMIIAGVTELSAKRKRNLAAVFGRDGEMIVNYEKMHLYEGEMYQEFGTGSKPGVFGTEGVAICKDYDFESSMRKYGEAGVTVMYAPAWDFVRDGWWHSRVAIVGAVANGYSLVRNAREGRLTISDDRGRVSDEASCENRELTSLIGKAGRSTGRTLYSRWGDWFGWTMVAVAFGALVYLAASKSFTRV